MGRDRRYERAFENRERPETPDGALLYFEAKPQTSWRKAVNARGNRCGGVLLAETLKKRENRGNKGGRGEADARLLASKECEKAKMRRGVEKTSKKRLGNAKQTKGGLKQV